MRLALAALLLPLVCAANPTPKNRPQPRDQPPPENILDLCGVDRGAVWKHTERRWVCAAASKPGELWVGACRFGDRLHNGSWSCANPLESFSSAAEQPAGKCGCGATGRHDDGHHTYVDTHWTLATGASLPTGQVVVDYLWADVDVSCDMVHWCHLGPRPCGSGHVGITD